MIQLNDWRVASILDGRRRGASTRAIDQQVEACCANPQDTQKLADLIKAIHRYKKEKSKGNFPIDVQQNPRWPYLSMLRAAAMANLRKLDPTLAQPLEKQTPASYQVQ